MNAAASASRFAANAKGFEWMHSGAMEQCGFTDPADGWQEVKRRLDRLRRSQEHQLYRPVAAA